MGKKGSFVWHFLNGFVPGVAVNSTQVTFWILAQLQKNYEIVSIRLFAYNNVQSLGQNYKPMTCIFFMTNSGPVNVVDVPYQSINGSLGPNTTIATIQVPLIFTPDASEIKNPGIILPQISLPPPQGVTLTSILSNTDGTVLTVTDTVVSHLYLKLRPIEQ